MFLPHPHQEAPGGPMPGPAHPSYPGWCHRWSPPEETIPLSSECISLLPGVLPHALCTPTHEPTSSLQADIWDRAGLTQLGANLLFCTR